MPLTVLHKGKYEFGVAPSQRSLDALFGYGVALVDKPKGPSSHEVSSFVRKMLGIKKAGHSGTLDPEVSGVLPVLLQNSCKLAPLLMGSVKEYVCVMDCAKEFSREELDAALENFRGKIFQTPPLASAVAKRLRVRTVYKLEILEVRGRSVLFHSRVQGGTYIRKLVEDAGRVLGAGTTMADLRRTLAAGIAEKDCVTLQELSDRLWLAREQGNEKPIRECVRPIEEVVKVKRVVVGDGMLVPLSSGSNLACGGVDALDGKIGAGDVVGIFTGKGELHSIARASLGTNEIAEKKNEREMAFDVMRVVQSVK
ncbi:RNA-guided pseudouridylation complex pseudouridine synthase subunit Cbf5 [Candidatus Micrarchaeota archaeon]|nr:RNA-guided pseudouridylation complex pseudouridine synthase subunit Cbf5 [Candidatus Micrarchaeota archaeon]